MVAFILTRFNYHWRFAFTALSFALFGVGGLMLGLLVFPCFLIIPNLARRQKIARSVIQRTFRIFIGFMRFFGVLTYDVSGFDKINQRNGLLIIPNHPTLLDVVFLVAFINQADCIVKASLFNNPFMFGATRTARYIPNRSDDAEGLVKQCIERIQNGSNLIVFPEGTRTVVGQPVTLKRGAANIAVRGNINPTPILISCTPSSLSKAHKWYNTPPKKMHFTFDVQNDFLIASALSPTEGLSARLLTKQLTHYFRKNQPCQNSN
jgi:1-acyl-sn-glycerol-3-phosphate acyltransferase